MDVFQTIATRRSIRSYRDLPVEPEKIEQILEAARWSPSANNRQDWKFIVIQNKTTIEQMIDVCRGQTFIAQAPVLLVACSLRPDSLMTCGHPRGTVDLSIAMTSMLLQAWSLGLGTCWLGAFSQEGVKKLLKIPEAVSVVAITPLGYPKVIPGPPARKPLATIVCHETYSEQTDPQ